MTNSNFDKIINRYGTGSLKYDTGEKIGLPHDMLHMWVADMDFMTANPVVAAMNDTANHGIFGYTLPDTSYFDALRAWWSSRFAYEFEEKSVVITPGVVFALAQAVRAFTRPGDTVLIQRPVYYPFSHVIEDNGRRLLNNPLRLGEDGRYHIDFNDLERVIHEGKPKMFILCSPHNPVGRVWTRDELRRVGEICIAANCLVISDEIHADFVYKGSHHTVFSTVSEEFRDHSIVCTSPSKTFNVAGLQVSNIIIENEELREKYKKELNASGYSQPNTVGIAACRAAYEQGAPWLEELKIYLSGNIDELRSADIRGVNLIEPEGTYLPWLDFRNTGLSQNEADETLLHKAHVRLDGGTMFGPEGEGFQRVNIACPRSVLAEAIERIKTVLR